MQIKQSSCVLDRKEPSSVSVTHLSEIIIPVCIPQQQYLIYWKWCQHKPSEGMECYWQLISHMETWFLWWNKMGFLPTCGNVNTTVEIHPLDVSEMHGEKARWELYNITSYFEKNTWSTTPQNSSFTPTNFLSHKPSK